MVAKKDDQVFWEDVATAAEEVREWPEWKRGKWEEFPATTAPPKKAQTALQSFHNGKLTGKRKQRIHTPQSVINVCLDLWGEIALDPAGSPDGLVPAKTIIHPPACGLQVHWPEHTYVNPPFNDLKPWLVKYRNAWEVLFLVPVRTHRRWFRKAMDESTHIIYLDPLKFEGYKTTFPAPLCLMYRGDPANVSRLIRSCYENGLVK